LYSGWDRLILETHMAGIRLETRVDRRYRQVCGRTQSPMRPRSPCLPPERCDLLCGLRRIAPLAGSKMVWDTPTKHMGSYPPSISHRSRRTAPRGRPRGLQLLRREESGGRWEQIALDTAIPERSTRATKDNSCIHATSTFDLFLTPRNRSQERAVRPVSYIYYCQDSMRSPRRLPPFVVSFRSFSFFNTDGIDSNPRSLSLVGALPTPSLEHNVMKISQVKKEWLRSSRQKRTQSDDPKEGKHVPPGYAL